MKKLQKKSLVATGLVATLATAACAVLLRGSRVRPGQVAVITGGSRGLGLALAHRFGRAGCRLVLAARHQEELELARHELIHSGDVGDENDILLVVCDLTDQAQTAGLIDQAIRTFGALDLLINNAGIIEVGPIQNQPLEAYRRAMDTNFFAALYTIHAALPHLLGRGGAIVNIASVGGKIPVPHLAPYVAAKFALTGFSETLHAELRQENIRVTTVCPGLMRTGGEEHAIFLGQTDKEEAWFKFGAKTPIISASVSHAANRVFNAVAAGRAEITITPQAWLAARIHGLAPATTQCIASIANRYLLPQPAAGSGSTLHIPETVHAEQPFPDPSPS